MLKLIRRVVGGIAAVALISGATAFAQSRVGTPQSGVPGIVNTMDEIKARQAAYDIANAGKPITYFEKPYRTVDRTKLKQNPDSPLTPKALKGRDGIVEKQAQTASVNFLGGNSPTPRPSRRTRWAPSARRSSSWRSTAASARSTRCPAPPTACSNITPDTFFNSGDDADRRQHHSNLTSDPRIRYDRLSGRWFIDDHRRPRQRHGSITNRSLMAVSDAASAGIIAGSTMWTFFYIHRHPGRRLRRLPDAGHRRQRAVHRLQHVRELDRPFTQHRRLRRAQELGAGGRPDRRSRRSRPDPGTARTGAGPFTPQGVDNSDPARDRRLLHRRRQLRRSACSSVSRVGNPGRHADAVSAASTVTVADHDASRSTCRTSATPAAPAGKLDGLDDRLYAAHMRNGRLWTAHNILVDTTGVATREHDDRPQRRALVRTAEHDRRRPRVVQSGTVFDSTATATPTRRLVLDSVDHGHRPGPRGVRLQHRRRRVARQRRDSPGASPATRRDDAWHAGDPTPTRRPRLQPGRRPGGATAAAAGATTRTPASTRSTT